MNLSATFIHRPVATALLTIGILLAGYERQKYAAMPSARAAGSTRLHAQLRAGRAASGGAVLTGDRRQRQHKRSIMRLGGAHVSARATNLTNHYQ